jgi:ketosteroid isomerase-like protein
MFNMLEQNKKVAVAILEAIASGDIDAVDRLMTDDAIWWVAKSTNVSGTHKKPEFLEIVRQILDKGDGPLSFTYDDITAEDDRVCVMCSSHLKVRGGKTYANDYHFLFHIRDGRIASGREYLDTHHLNDIFGGPQ